MPKYALQNQIEQARRRFEADFRPNRVTWGDLRKRKLDIELPEEVVKGDDYYQYKTPELEKAAFDWQDIGTTNPTMFDVVTIDQSVEAKENGRNVLMWSAHGWELENEARSWDMAVIEGQVVDGVKVMQLCYRPQKVIEGDAKAKRKKQRHPFYWEDRDIHGMCWLGDETQEGGPSFAAYESEIPFTEAAIKYKKAGLQFGVKGGKCGWFGQDIALDHEHHMETVKVTTIDAIDPEGEECVLEGCEHVARKIYVHISGKEDEMTDDTLFEEYDSPFPGCSFFIIPGRRSSDRDMDARFRPMILPMYVEAEATNYLSTLLYAQIREDYGPAGYYIDYSQANPLNIPEGESVSFDFHGASEGEIQGFPGEVRRMPRTLSPHLPAEIAAHNQRMADFMPNRFLTGNAYTEASNATGTAFLAQQQQASLPANGLLQKSDAAILKSRTYEYHAIRYWGRSDPPGQPTEWYAVMSGNNRNVVTRGTQPKHAEVFKVTASMLEDLDFDLRIYTNSETLAEQQARYQLARQKKQDGAITPEQFLREAGSDDVEGQKQQLRAAETYGLMIPEIQAAKKAAITKIYKVLGGIDLVPAPSLAGAPMGAPESVSASGGLGGLTHFAQPPGFQQQQQANATQDLQQTLVGAGAGNINGGSSPLG